MVWTASLLYRSVGDARLPCTTAPTRHLLTSRWSPLLGGRVRERAVEAILAIAESLDPHSVAMAPDSNAADAASLASGTAGLALFFAYLAQSGLTTRAAEPAEHFLDRSQGIVATTDMTPSLYGGFSGVAWATEHLNAYILGSDEDLNEEIDEGLRAYLRRS